MKAGLRERWTPLGHTVLYGEYEESNDGGAVGSADGFIIVGGAQVADIHGSSTSETTLWGLGVVQEIDAAAMSLWLSYRHLEGEVDRRSLASTRTSTTSST